MMNTLGRRAQAQSDAQAQPTPDQDGQPVAKEKVICLLWLIFEVLVFFFTRKSLRWIIFLRAYAIFRDVVWRVFLACLPMWLSRVALFLLYDSHWVSIVRWLRCLRRSFFELIDVMVVFRTRLTRWWWPAVASSATSAGQVARTSGPCLTISTSSWRTPTFCCRAPPCVDPHPWTWLIPVSWRTRSWL